MVREEGGKRVSLKLINLEKGDIIMIKVNSPPIAYGVNVYEFIKFFNDKLIVQSLATKKEYIISMDYAEEYMEIIY